MGSKENNIVKEFVKRQTTPISIGVPKQRPAETAGESTIAPDRTPAAERPLPKVEAARRHVGRPKSDIEKTKLSVYVPVEYKKKLTDIQHRLGLQSLNDVLAESVKDTIKKYSI